MFGVQGASVGGDGGGIGRLTPVLGGVLALAGAVVYGVWEWVFRGRSSYNTVVFPLDDADEWRYTACSRLVAHGYGIFTQVFSAQPPLLFVSLAGGMRAVSDSISGARAVEIGFGVVALIAAAALAWRISGPVAAGAAVLFLAVSPLFLVYSRAVEAEGPMSAMVTAGLALAAWEGRWRGRVPPLAVAGGLCIASAILFKLFAVAALVPGLWLVATLPGSRKERAERVVWFSGAAVVPPALEMALVAPGPQWDQVVRLHDRAAGLSLPNALSNWEILGDFAKVDPGVVVLAVVGIAVLVLMRHLREAVLLGLWAGGLTAMLALFHPLFPHHAAILLTGLGVAAATAVGEGWQALVERRMTAAVMVAAGCLLYLGLSYRLAHEDRHALGPWDRRASDALAGYLRGTTPATAFVATDDLASVDLAHRLVPPGLCDPSTVRRLAGYMPDSTLIDQTRRYHAAVVAPTGIYLQATGYLTWLHDHYVRSSGPAELTVYRVRKRR